jgi:membrane-bound ClpP family serine protease
MISYSLVGLAIVILSWAIQLFSMDKSKKINPVFVLTYSLGVIFLVYDGFNSGLMDLAIANLISFIVSIFVLIRVFKK